MQEFIDYLAQKPHIKTFFQGLSQPGNHLVTGILPSARAYFLASLQQNKVQDKILVVTPNLLAAHRMQDDLIEFLDESLVKIYQIEENIAAEFSVSSPESRASRLNGLSWLLDDQSKGVLLVPLSGLRQSLADPKIWGKLILTLEIDQNINREETTQRLVDMGYHREEMVEKKGEFSVRGEIIDIFPLTEENPIRLSLFDTEIEDIRYFDVLNQTKITNVDQVKIFPAKEFVVQANQLKSASKTIRDRATTEIKEISDVEVAEQLFAFYQETADLWDLGKSSQDLRYFQDTLYPQGFTLLDYLSDSGYLVIDDYARIIEEDDRLSREMVDWVAHKSAEGKLLPQSRLAISFRDSQKSWPESRLFLSNLQKGFGHLRFNQILPMRVHNIPQFFGQMPMVKVEVDRMLKQGYTIFVGAPNRKQADKIAQTFHDVDIDQVISTGNIVEQTVNIIPLNLNIGFDLADEKIAFIGEKDLFNKVHKQRKSRPKNITNAERIKNYSQLQEGDYVVHAAHGIGKFVGTETITVDGINQDYISIIYKDGGGLFVPVDQLSQLQKYTGSEAKTPKLNKLGGAEWQKTKSKVASKVEDIADELLEIYAAREAQKGYAFSPDTPEQKDFEDAFPYTETEDQLRSTEEIKRDMEKERPMDRLLVGDVGYGKTEVAMRAIFKAVMDGKQAAFLVPTTILAQQHYESLTQRFEGWPFKIELMSRFRTPSQQKKTLEGIKSGAVDIIVGTHRILSKDMVWLDLGLLVVDEEQRFGVKDKERLKQIKTSVDVLTLTATPIPRTLHMSMIGVRDLSVLETPPANRYPVQTYVMEWDVGAVRDAIEREMARDGQVFYLYNRVDTIQDKVAHIQSLVPDARIAYAHGQMTEVQLEDVMMAFNDGEYDVLVTTTIIETGVDIPNANTLFVEDADRMGLSTLYQLRGRVGRTNRIAFCYFLYAPGKTLSEVAENRLQALKDFTELGSGFKIAMRDLSIRGAGNLLGKQQSGYMDSVGFDMYSEMLMEAVRRKQGDVEDINRLRTIELDLKINAYIPEDYVADDRQKLDLYKRINQIQNDEEIGLLIDEISDRFGGEIPISVYNLLDVAELKVHSRQAAVEKISRKEDSLVVEFLKAKKSVEFMKMVFQALEKTSMRAKLGEKEGHTVIDFKIKGYETADWLRELMTYLAELANKIQKKKEVS